MDSHPPCLELENVSRGFGGLTAVDAVNLTVLPGERRAVIGPNGAGKTTLFNLISGELRATAGRIRLFGRDVTRLAPHQRAGRGIARTFQITRIFPALTVLENVLLACMALDRRRFTMLGRLSACAPLMRRADALLAQCNLQPLRHERTRNLSYGDQRKVEVALAMAGRPRLLLLDEPMAGLSSSERQSMQALLASLDPSIAVLLIEHDMDVAFAFARAVTVLSQGKVLADGPNAEVSANPGVQQIYLGAQTSADGSPVDRHPADS
jgi:branched-chain amino acid transport system ATP-binding protein